MRRGVQLSPDELALGPVGLQRVGEFIAVGVRGSTAALAMAEGADDELWEGMGAAMVEALAVCWVQGFEQGTQVANESMIGVAVKDRPDAEAVLDMARAQVGLALGAGIGGVDGLAG